MRLLLERPSKATINYKKILKQISSYKNTESKYRYYDQTTSSALNSTLNQLETCCNEKKSAEEFRKIFHDYAEKIQKNKPDFYIESPRAKEAQLLFNIASLIAVPDPKKTDTPILDTYKMLLPLNNDESMGDLEENQNKLILSTGIKTMYLLIIEGIGNQQNRTHKFQNYYPPHYPLGETELDQIQIKDSKIYSKINSIRFDEPGWISTTTLNKLKPIAEIALSYNGHSPDNAELMKSRYRTVISDDRDFANYLKVKGYEWEKEEDTYFLLTYPYLYFKDYLETLAKDNPTEFQAFSCLRVNNCGEQVFIKDALYSCWFKDECMSLKGRIIAQFVYETAPKEVTLSNFYLEHHASNLHWESRASQTKLVRTTQTDGVQEDKKRIKPLTVTTSSPGIFEEESPPSSPSTDPILTNTNPVSPSFWSSCSRSKKAALVLLPPISIFAALVAAEATLTLLENSATSSLDNLGDINISLAIVAGIVSVVAAVAESYLVRQREDRSFISSP